MATMLWDSSASSRMSDPPAAVAPAELRRFVRDFDVSWDSAPSVQQHEGRRVTVGYDVSLFARHPDGLRADPSSARTRALREHLAALADYLRPSVSNGLACRLRVEPLRLVLRRESEWAPEVEARLEILHSGSTFDEAGEAEKRCRREIERRLRALCEAPVPARQAQAC